MFCSQENDTYASVSLERGGLGNVMRVRGNEILGTMGVCFEQLLIKKALRKCRIQGVFEHGQKLANGSYSGILGMLESKKIDLLLRGEPAYLLEKWLGKSVPIAVESPVLVHPIREQEGFSYFNLLNNFTFGVDLTAIYILSLIAILAVSFLINRLSLRIRLGRQRTPKLWKRIAIAVRNFRIRKLSAVGIFVLSVHLFIWLTEEFLFNNIQTNQVVVDTSHLIKDEHSLFSTNMVACFVQNNQFHKMIATSPSKNILWKVLNEKTQLTPSMVKEREILKSDRCLLPKKIEMFDLLKNPKIFLLDERKSVDFILAASLLFEQMVQKVWLKAKIVDFEYPLVLYLNPDKQKRIGQMILRNAEAGLFVRSYECIDAAGRNSCRSSKISLFETLDQYTENMSGFSDLVVDNFRFIFLYHFLLCSLVFVLFCMHHLIKFARRSTIFLRLLSSSYHFVKRWSSFLLSALTRYRSRFASNFRRFARYLSRRFREYFFS